MSARARNILVIGCIALVAAIRPAGVAAQGPDAAARIAAQRTAMAALKPMDGTWRGPAWRLQPGGEKHEIVQTERIGPFLDGSIKVIEGRGYAPDGTVAFNAFGIVSYDPATKAYSLRSHAMGHSGDFAFAPTADGYTWSHPAGPGATIRYVATIRDGTLTEVGDRIVDGRPPLRVFEMRLKRIGDTDWPMAGTIPPR